MPWIIPSDREGRWNPAGLSLKSPRFLSNQWGPPQISSGFKACFSAMRNGEWIGGSPTSASAGQAQHLRPHPAAGMKAEFASVETDAHTNLFGQQDAADCATMAGPRCRAIAFQNG